MRIGMAIVLFLLASIRLEASKGSDAVVDLEQSFANRDLEIVQSAEGLPDDVRLTLQSQPHSHRVADFGEHWNSIDRISEDVPMIRHLFSGISNDIAAVVYQSGGYRAPMVFLLLTHRGSDWYCKYMIDAEAGLLLSMKIISHRFRDPKAEKPSCDMLMVSRN